MTPIRPLICLSVYWYSWFNKFTIFHGSATWIRGEVLNIQIDDKIISSTTKCPSDFFCLKNTGKPMCDVDRDICIPEYSIQESGLFVFPQSVNGCPYQMSFGYGFMCHCPTRHEIYKKYNI